jgi:hypothetical protein
MRLRRRMVDGIRLRRWANRRRAPPDCAGASAHHSLGLGLNGNIVEADGPYLGWLIGPNAGLSFNWKDLVPAFFG